MKLIENDRPLPDKYRFLLFGDKREVELVWNGKTSEICNIVLPFQVIEQVDEPRDRIGDKEQSGLKLKKGEARDQLFFDYRLDERGRQKAGWTNKLIWGENKLILSSLKNGPLREEIEKEGGIKLIYIDPPFDVGADFSMDIEIGEDTFTKRPNVLEELAYRDTWGRGADSFIAMIYERLMLMRDLLAEDGSIYVHCDWHIGHSIKLIVDEIFGINNFHNHITWKRSTPRGNAYKHFSELTDYILFYTKTGEYVWNPQYGEYREEYTEKYYSYVDSETGKRFQPTSLLGHKGVNPEYEWKGILKPWRYPSHRLDELEAKKLIYWPKDGGIPRLKRFLDEQKGVPIQSLWEDIPPVNSQANEDTKYATQKPEALLERIIKASSNQNDVVADFFCGSGTTLAVAERLERKWIGSDLGKFAIHTTRKRMIQVQRQMKSDGKDFRAFEILNLGKYERAHYIGVNVNLREEERQKQLAQKEKDFIELILRAYKAEKIENLRCFQGKKAGRVVAVGPINLPVTRLFVEEIILECREKRISRVDILAFEFEMGLFPNIQEEAKAKGIDLALKYIPREVFDKRAVEKNQVVFHDVSYIEVKPHARETRKKGESAAVAVELTDFSVYYSQDSIDNAAASLKDGTNRIVVEAGKIIKVMKDKNGIVTKETLTKNWTDWIDYWSVDFDFESKREIVRVKNEASGEIEEVWTGDFIFENEWQSFRTKKDRLLELKTPFHDCHPGRYKIAVKVVDIFGNDTMKIIDVNVGGSK
jgi:DNA modification methylase